MFSRWSLSIELAASAHQRSKPLGGYRWYLRLYSLTACSSVVLARSNFLFQSFSACSISSYIGWGASWLTWRRPFGRYTCLPGALSRLGRSGVSEGIMSTLISSETRVRANWKPEKKPRSRFDRTKIKNAAQIPQTCLEARRKRVMVQADFGIASVLPYLWLTFSWCVQHKENLHHGDTWSLKLEASQGICPLLNVKVKPALDRSYDSIPSFCRTNQITDIHTRTYKKSKEETILLIMIQWSHSWYATASVMQKYV